MVRTLFAASTARFDQTSIKRSAVFSCPSGTALSLSISANMASKRCAPLQPVHRRASRAQPSAADHSRLLEPRQPNVRSDRLAPSMPQTSRPWHFPFMHHQSRVLVPQHQVLRKLAVEHLCASDSFRVLLSAIQADSIMANGSRVEELSSQFTHGHGMQRPGAVHFAVSRPPYPGLHLRP
jgi:hypothetical protein